MPHYFTAKEKNEFLEMPICETATTPLHHFENLKLKIQHNAPNNFPHEIDQGFYNVFPER